jgi:hypothetical protein
MEALLVKLNNTSPADLALAWDQLTAQLDGYSTKSFLQVGCRTHTRLALLHC